MPGDVLVDCGSTLGNSAYTLVGCMAGYRSVLADCGSTLGSSASIVVGCRAGCESTCGRGEYTMGVVCLPL